MAANLTSLGLLNGRACTTSTRLHDPIIWRTKSYASYMECDPAAGEPPYVQMLPCTIRPVQGLHVLPCHCSAQPTKQDQPDKPNPAAEPTAGILFNPDLSSTQTCTYASSGTCVRLSWSQQCKMLLGRASQSRRIIADVFRQHMPGEICHFCFWYAC